MTWTRRRRARRSRSIAAKYKGKAGAADQAGRRPEGREGRSSEAQGQRRRPEGDRDLDAGAVARHAAIRCT
ncbi:MAG: hypothetical protein M0C28_11535 [Candidatus Moduliflexus flocculans]|nr:hypothetical protein [Candidatus Moduliflexus flocculans]